jgi:hypothetical protein
LRNILSALLIAGAAAGLFQHVNYRGFPYAPFEELDKSLRSQIEPGDIIVHSNKLSLLPAIYFDRTLPQTYVGDPTGSSTDTLAEATREVLRLSTAPDIEAATLDGRRIWFIIFARSIQEVRPAGSQTHPHLEYLNQNFTQIKTQQWKELQIYLFEKKQ